MSWYLAIVILVIFIGLAAGVAWLVRYFMALDKKFGKRERSRKPQEPEPDKEDVPVVDSESKENKSSDIQESSPEAKGSKETLEQKEKSLSKKESKSENSKKGSDLKEKQDAKEKSSSDDVKEEKKPDEKKAPKGVSKTRSSSKIKPKLNLPAIGSPKRPEIKTKKDKKELKRTGTGEDIGLALNKHSVIDDEWNK